MRSCIRKKDGGCSKRDVKISIKVQFALVFMGVMLGVILLCNILTNILLKHFYQQRKIEILKEVSETIENAILSAELISIEISQGINGTETEFQWYFDPDSLGDEYKDNADFYHFFEHSPGLSPLDEDFVYYYYFGTEFVSELNAIARRNNISIVIVGSDSKVQFKSMNCEPDTSDRLLAYVFKAEEVKNRTLIEEYDIYSIYRTSSNGMEDIDMVGRLPGDVNFMLSVPVESIEEAATFANRFFINIGLIGAVIGAVIIWIIASKMTKPIAELNNISEKMVLLDFDARYNGKSKNEIGVLGCNMNKLSESLEKSISSLKSANLELQKDIEHKEQLDEMRREFVSNVSHELKTPIAIIQGYAEGLKEGISDDPESMDYYCDVIIDEASKMNSMVKQFLTLNQLEFGGESVSLERFDVNAMISGYLASAGMLAKQSGIEILFENNESINVWGDEFKAEEVLNNYFSNAVHYCSEDNEGNRYIRVYTESKGDNCRICVFNTGNHIPKDSIERLWEKFYKVDKARTREYGGSGVGLSIVKAIQESLNMCYGVENVENGVVFWFELEADNGVNG